MGPLVDERRQAAEAVQGRSWRWRVIAAAGALHASAAHGSTFTFGGQREGAAGQWGPEHESVGAESDDRDAGRWGRPWRKSRRWHGDDVAMTKVSKFYQNTLSSRCGGGGRRTSLETRWAPATRHTEAMPPSPVRKFEFSGYLLYFWEQ